MIITRKELNKRYSISHNVWANKHDELMLHLQEYMDITETKSSTGRYTYEIKGEMPDIIPSLRTAQTKQKKKDYEKFTVAALGTEFKPNSKSKIARDAIADFGYDKYNHTSYKAVTERYIKEPFNKYGISDGNQYWCFYSTYEVMDEAIVTEWRKILSEEKIGEEEAANAFYRQAQGEDISTELQFYKNAMNRFKEKYNDIPVLVKKWKCK